jgi:hypothetical protein
MKLRGKQMYFSFINEENYQMLHLSAFYLAYYLQATLLEKHISEKTSEALKLNLMEKIVICYAKSLESKLVILKMFK